MKPKQYGITSRPLYSYNAHANYDVPEHSVIIINNHNYFTTLDGRKIGGVDANNENDVIKVKYTKLLKLLFE